MSCDMNLKKRLKNHSRARSRRTTPIVAQRPASASGYATLTALDRPENRMIVGSRDAAAWARALPHVNTAPPRASGQSYRRRRGGRTARQRAQGTGRERDRRGRDADRGARWPRAGSTSVEVTDDGCGMTPAEMALALERHATSKLPDDAIEAVATLGFRGEALPSIASVARLTIESRVRGADGWRADRRQWRAWRARGRPRLPPGTRVRVEALFERVPARRKFLRSAAIANMPPASMSVRRLAMARPEIGFTLEHDGRRVALGAAGRERSRRASRRSPIASWSTNSVVDRSCRAARCGWAASPGCRPSTAASPITNICSSTAAR